MSALEGSPRGVGGSNLNDGVTYPINIGKAGEVLTSDVHGKYYTQTVRGQVYTGSSPAAGCVIPKYDSTTPTFCLWNPQGNTKNFELIKISMSVTVLGTSVVDSLFLGKTSSAGSGLSATGAIVAFASTPTSIFNGLLDSGVASTAKFSSAGTITLLAAATPFYHLPFSRDLATTGAGAPVMSCDFDGTIIVPPGVAISLAATPAATSTTYNISLTWAEVPIL